MSTPGEFVVEVTSAPDEAPELVSARVAQLLKLSPDKAAALVARVPGVVTRGLPEERAVRVVLRLQAAGLAAVHRRARAEATASAAAPAAEPVSASAEAAPPTPAAPTPAPELVSDPDERRDPTGFDRIPSLDATQVDAPVEPDPKLTPMREAGFGAADVVLPTHTPPPRRPPSLVDLGSVSLPLEPAAAPPAASDDPAVAARRRLAERSASASASASVDADPTMILPPDAEPPTSAAPLAASGRRTLTDADLRLTPPPGVAYRSTGGGTRRPATLTPPPDEVLKRSGVLEHELAANVERRRGRFSRRLSALVTLPVTLSWVLSAAFIYVLLPEALRDELWVPLAAATAIAALSGALAAGLATGRIARDVVRLRDDAQRIAMGELDAPVRVRRQDELGDLAASLDRMRVSLHEALGRLRKRG